MAAKLSEGDTISMQGEVTLVRDDGTVTVRLQGYEVPITTRGEHLSLMAKKKGWGGPQEAAVRQAGLTNASPYVGRPALTPLSAEKIPGG